MIDYDPTTMSQSSRDFTDPVSQTETHLPEDDRFRLLSHPRRRLMLDVLNRHETPLPLRELARGIASKEGGSRTDGEGRVDEVAITLHHIHLPKMSRLGVLEYNPETRLIS